jgi:hypothetical protein
MLIRYYLKSATSGLSIVIADAAGQEVARLIQGGGGGGRGGVNSVTGNAGINTVVWDTRLTGRGSGAGTAARGGGATRGGASLETLAPLGDYTVSLVIGTNTLTQKARIAKTQGWNIGMTPTIIR